LIIRPIEAQTIQALSESQERFDHLFVSDPEATVYVSRDFCVQDANPQFHEGFRHSLHKVRGRQISYVAFVQRHPRTRRCGKSAERTKTEIHKRFPEKAKIMSTGYPTLQNATQSLDHGAAAFIMKPVQPETLLGIVEEYLKEREERWRG